MLVGPAASIVSAEFGELHLQNLSRIVDVSCSLPSQSLVDDFFGCRKHGRSLQFEHFRRWTKSERLPMARIVAKPEQLDIKLCRFVGQHVAN